MFFFYTNYLGFSPEFVGRIKLLDGVAQLLGTHLTQPNEKIHPFIPCTKYDTRHEP